MYIPKSYKNENSAEIEEFIQSNSFGILVSQTENKLWATHIPLELGKNEKDEQVLTGHISRGNPQWKNFTDKSAVLAIFSGPHAYISSSWYDHENVPTWNYIAIHVYGMIQIIEEEKLLHSLKKLVDKYEVGSEKPVTVEEMSEKFLKNELRGIVGFEIVIQEIQAAYKLSQTRHQHDHQNIIKELEKQGDKNSLNIADEMRKTKKY
ncbi:MAG: FMN-binding negative transcriptional regulator [Verrucomicrobia bacterium]|nr:FMN-binding negative transcriptional regulator [Cytophagales bacterium]